MNQLSNRPLPTNPRRIVLVNPTKYLGNLLLAGGLMQRFAAYCHERQCELLLVLDESFRELCGAAFRDVSVLWYPRQALRHATAWRRVRLFVGFVRQLRAFRADLAFNIEEDSLSSRLTQFSGATFRLGCSPSRHRFGYEHVLDIDYGGSHRWYSYQAVFTALGLPPEASAKYLNLHVNQPSTEVIDILRELGIDQREALIAIHPAATKDYKKWPEAAFKELCNLLIKHGYSPVLLGAGNIDAERCARIAAGAPVNGAARLFNLCNRLSLAELAGLFLQCRGIVGNDSGPSHLASAQGLPGVVIFGPSDPSIWGPLGARSRVLRKIEQCDPRCSRRACFAGYRCLEAIRPQEVLDTLLGLLASRPAGETASPPLADRPTGDSR